MFHRYKILKRKKELNNRNFKTKSTKNAFKVEKSEKEKIIIMFKNSALLLNVFNRLNTNQSLLDENIEEFSVFIFSNLMKCKKEKVIIKNIDCIKKILQSKVFFKVQNTAFDYFKSLFMMNKFPKRLVSQFKEKFQVQLQNDQEFSRLFTTKYKT
ncbi:hypothetical protein M153_13479000518 [Pseudoloma neurophilia]|uniref:Uncharacterized protein n=1 Tax=Pseudoloma neurophilia TaxID=146866 RepID=A0A0R0LRA9_9MICR|nr:hypothetical protein M153_13479000518 [Pseudoloma neurophilia]